MNYQKKRITESEIFLKDISSFKKNPKLAIVTYYNPVFLKDFEILKKIDYAQIPPEFENTSQPGDGEFIFAKLKDSSKELFIMNGRFYFYNGYSMRDAVYPIYVLKHLGVETIIFIDEAGYLNPRFSKGGVAFIYDHINLMGDNPLIGENESSLGLRFPDMSNAYDDELYKKIENILIDNKFKYYPSVYLGITCPETETEAECRFYREIGADILGYGLVPENLAAVHCGIKSLAFGMLSRELVADRLKEISPEEQTKNRITAENYFGTILKDIINIV